MGAEWGNFQQIDPSNYTVGSGVGSVCMRWPKPGERKKRSRRIKDDKKSEAHLSFWSSAKKQEKEAETMKITKSTKRRLKKRHFKGVQIGYRGLR